MEEKQQEIITHGSLWALLGTASVPQTEAIWQRLEQGEIIEYGGYRYTYLAYEHIRRERLTSPD